jgi:hypothetical protein
MEAMGIVDEEEIIRRRKEKDLLLRDKFNLETFEQKYEKELRMREEKKRRLIER